MRETSKLTTSDVSGAVESARFLQGMYLFLHFYRQFTGLCIKKSLFIRSHGSNISIDSNENNTMSRSKQA